MPRSPDFRKPKTLPDIVSDLRRPKPIAETGWHFFSGWEDSPGFDGGWFNSTGTGGSAASWYLSEDGETRLRGHVEGGDEDSVMTILPVEVRPEYSEFYTVPIINKTTRAMIGHAGIEIRPDGELWVRSMVYF